MIKVLYTSGKRGKELQSLALLKERHKVEFRHVKLHLSSMKGLSPLRSAIDIYKSVRLLRPNVILVETASLASLGALMLKYLLGIPLAVRFKGDMWGEYAEIAHDIPLRNKIAKFLNFRAGNIFMKRADAILPISRRFAEILGGKTSASLCIMHNPFEKPSEAISATTLDEQDFFLTVTNFNFWGKVEPLALAIKKNGRKLKEQGFRWVVLGEGFFMDKFRGIVKDEMESGVVSLLGSRDPYPYYKRAAAMFYVSGMDGLPNVLLESFYHKLLVVIDSGCPAAEFVTGGVNGVVIDFTDASAVEEIVLRLGRDRGSFDGIARRAYEHVVDDFSVERVSRQLLDCLLTVITGENPREADQKP